MAVFQGWKASDTFYERLNRMFGTAFLFFVAGFWALVALMVWTALRACHRRFSWLPIAVFVVIFQWCMYTWMQLYVNELPLEFFHLPMVFRIQVTILAQPASAPSTTQGLMAVGS